MGIMDFFRKKSGPAPHLEDRCDPLSGELIDACLSRDVGRAERLLRAGAKPNALRRSPLGDENALVYAYGRADLLELLLKYGADPNLRAGGQALPLEVACAEGDYKTALTLIDHGASVRTRDNDGWTPLMFACGNRPSVPLAEKLLREGSNPNECDKAGWSALMSAAKTGDEQLIQLLIKSGANCDAVDNDGNSAARVAMQFNHPGATALLRS